MDELSLLKGLPECIHVRDADLRVTWATDHACAVFGWSPSDFPLAPGETEDLSEAAKTTRQAGQWMGILARKDAHDSTSSLASRWSALKGADGSLTAFFILEYDVLEGNMAHEQMIRAQRMESIGTLAGGVAHDINNVLGPIILGAEMMRRRIDDPWALKKIEGIEQSARRGADIVKQVLDFSRGTTGEKIPVQIRHVMKELVEFAQSTFSRQMAVEGSFPRDLPLLLGDASQIRQAVLNLMVNARDALQGAGSITVDMEGISLTAEEAAALSPDARDGDFVRISVTDDGCGMMPDTMERIFEPFFSTHQRGQSSGLGLSTTLAIAKGHDGFLSATSEPGKGSCFSIYLPQATTPDATAEDTVPLAEAVPGKNTYSILVVDDEPMMLEMNADLLESFGHTTLTASHGQAGLDIFLKNPQAIDLVITDINMPVMDGPTMVRNMREVRADLPVVAVSGLSEEDHNRDGTVLAEMDREGITMLHKPYTTNQLMNAIGLKMGDQTEVPGSSTVSPDSTQAPDATLFHTGDTLSDSDFDELMGGDW